MLPNSFLSQVLQVSVVTRDIDKALKEYAHRLGIGPWRVYTFAPPNLTQTRLRGKDTHYTMRLALAWVGNTMWELVQPLEGVSVYQEFLDTHGEGIHHVAFGTGNLSFDEAVARFTAQGCPIVMEGVWCGIHYAYLETEAATKTIFEIWDWPPGMQLPEPEEWYPYKTE